MLLMSTIKTIHLSDTFETKKKQYRNTTCNYKTILNQFLGRRNRTIIGNVLF